MAARYGVSALLALVVALVIAGCNRQQSDRRDGPGAHDFLRTGGKSSPAPVAQRLHAPPRDCRGPNPRTTVVARAYGPLVGAAPVWAGFYASYRREAHAYRAPDAPRTRHGFRVKVLWIMSSDQRDPVRITGANLSTGLSVSFEVEGSRVPRTSATLDPAAEDVIVQRGGWKEFPSYIYFARAGCYELVVRWPSGSWRLAFGLGA
jgi:hypothetical protein